MNYININGKLTTAGNVGIPVDNGAFRYGYGLFETMLVQDCTIRLKQYHWERLFAGAKQLLFDLPLLITPEWLEQQVIATVKKNKLEKLCRVRLQLFAAGGGLFSDNTKPGFLIECFPLEADTLKFNQNGLVVGLAEGLRKSVDSLSGLKSCNALIYAIGARQAKANKWNDTLICNTSGNIIESTIANIFWVKDKTIYSPPLSDGCIAGIMRRYVMEKTEVKERSLSLDEILSADEVFLTNAIKGIRWIKHINHKQYGNNQTNSTYNLLQM